MAVPPNRSPSPLSSRPIPPHSRNSSDSNSGAARRSFNGNPFHNRPSILTNHRGLNPVTPANSPAGFGRRNSLGNEEKENEKDQNLKTVKSAKLPANGSKNFMSPTISAASKFTPSPRKKILVERNDPVRTSISLSEGKASFFSEISSEINDDVESNKNCEGKDAVLEGPPRSSRASKRVTFLEVPSDIETATNVDSSSKNAPSCFLVSPDISPLDADPSLPPYDPRVNYLSPRPQFLHYKPKPRIEVLLNKEKEHDFREAKKLDDNFMLEDSESFSDSDGTEGSSISEHSQEDSEDSSSVENVLLPEAEEARDARVYEEIVEGKEEPKALNSPISHDMCEGIVEGNDKEKTTISPPKITYDVSEGAVYDIGKAKPRFFTKVKAPFVLLVLLFACFSIWGADSPFDSISHLSLLINNLGRGRDNLGTVKFMNLTDLQSDDMSVFGALDDHKQIQMLIREDIEEEDLEEEEADAESGPFEEQPFPEAFSDGFLEKESEEEIELGTEEEQPPVPEQLAGMNDLESSETLWKQEEVSSYVDIEAPESEVYKINAEVIQSGNLEVDMNLDSEAKIVSSLANTNHESTPNTLPEIIEDASSEAVEYLIGGSENNYSAFSIMGMASLALALVSAAAFVYLKKQVSSNNSNLVVQTDELLSSKKKITDPESSIPQITMFQEKASSRNWATEVDVAGESCPSEMSSFDSRKDLRGGGGGKANEAQSQEKKVRTYSKRESLASSSDFSTVSPSYGSFTTYEKISSKNNGNGDDDEIITPVRRSSRLRNQVTCS